MPEDLFRPAPPPSAGAKESGIVRKLAWFAALSAASLAATASLAYFLRALLFFG